MPAGIGANCYFRLGVAPVIPLPGTAVPSGWLVFVVLGEFSQPLEPASAEAQGAAGSAPTLPIAEFSDAPPIVPIAEPGKPLPIDEAPTPLPMVPIGEALVLTPPDELDVPLVALRLVPTVAPVAGAPAPPAARALP